MKIRICADAREFLDRAESWLLQDEAANGVILGAAHQLATGTHAFSDPTLLATVEEGDAVVGCAIRTPPFQVALTRLPPDSIGPLVEEFAKVYAELPGVHGPEMEAFRFSRNWVAQTRRRWSVKFKIRVHVLTQVIAPRKPPAGELRKAVAGEEGLADEWAQGFVRETGMSDHHEDFGRRLVDLGALYFWDDGEPRSMVGVTRYTRSGAGISAVYTPPGFRGRGYASTSVATLSQQLLDSDWSFCFLYTDLANPTSNAIYADIGYRPVQDSLHIQFS